jgi:hypothetical protein
VAQKKSRQTFEKLKREQAIREKRVRKQERKAAARLAKAGGGIDDSTENGGSTEHGDSAENGDSTEIDEGADPSPESAVDEGR